MRLYHYLETRWALDDIRRRRLKLSTIEDMNDPYEGFSVCSDHEVTQAALEKTKRETDEKYIALCFSLSPDNILMWSHYGDKHKGICLGFDVSDELTRPVEYIHDVQTVGNMIVERREDFSVEEGTKIVDLQAGAKYDGWCYEQEVRIHLGRNEKDEETGQYFREFSEHLVLKEVIAGARFPYSKKLIQDALSASSAQEEVTIRKARRSTQKFAIVLDEKWISAMEPEERPYHIQAIYDLQADNTTAKFRPEIDECRKVIAQLSADDHSSDQQIARVNILRYLNLQLSRATAWADGEADLLAIVLRSAIELRGWAEFVSESPEQATQFLNEQVVVDAHELDKYMRKAFPTAAFPALPSVPKADRVNPQRIGETVEYDFKLCSKLIHPSAIMLNHPEMTIRNEDHKAHLRIEVLLYAWMIVTRFHDLNWVP